jgi:HSP20 family protein
MIMIRKQPGRSGGQAGRTSESDPFINSMPNSQWLLSRHGNAWRPFTDVYETDDGIVVKVEVAGMTEDDFSIVLAERTLIIAGARRDPARKRGYYQMEIPYGEFRTEIYLSEAVDTEHVEALYKDGFLLVTLPRRKARRVTIQPSVEP